MSDPFAVFKHFPPPQTPPPSQEREVNPDDTLYLCCKACGVKIERSQVEPGNPWVHFDDTVPLSGLIFRSTYNHEAIPDVIDTTAREN